jgi:hypothetical protein
LVSLVRQARQVSLARQELLVRQVPQVLLARQAPPGLVSQVRLVPQEQAAINAWPTLDQATT